MQNALVAGQARHRGQRVEVPGTCIAGRDQSHDQAHRRTVRRVEFDILIEVKEHGERLIDRIHPRMRHRHSPPETRAAEGFAFAQRLEHHVILKRIGGSESLRQFGQDGTLVGAGGAAHGFGNQSERERHGGILYLGSVGFVRDPETSDLGPRIT